MSKLLSLLLVTTCFTSTLLASAVEDNADGSLKRLRTITPEPEGDVQERSLKRHKDFNSVKDDSSSSSASSSNTQMPEADIAAKYSAAKSKFYSADPAERASGLEILKAIASDARHPDYQWLAHCALWDSSLGKGETNERVFARSFLKIIATTDEHPKQCKALMRLNASDKCR